MIVVVVFSVFNSVAYFAPNFEVFCLLRFLSGIGIGGAIPLTITLVSEFAPAGVRARFLTFSGGSFTIGWALAGLIAMGVVPHFGWRIVLLIGSCQILFLPALQAYLPESVRFLVVKKRYPDAIREIQRIERLAGIEPRTWRPDAFTQPGLLSNAGFREVFRPGLRAMTVLVWCTYLFSMLALYGLSTGSCPRSLPIPVSLLSKVTASESCSPSGPLWVVIFWAASWMPLAENPAFA